MSDNICLANAWMGSIGVSGAHKILDTQADHCPHNNLASLLLTASPVSKQTIIPLDLYSVSVYIYYLDTYVKVKIHHKHSWKLLAIFIY